MCIFSSYSQLGQMPKLNFLELSEQDFLHSTNSIQPHWKNVEMWKNTEYRPQNTENTKLSVFPASLSSFMLYYVVVVLRVITTSKVFVQYFVFAICIFFASNFHCIFFRFQHQVRSLKPNEFVCDIHVPELLVFPAGTDLHRHKLCVSGCIILQDKVSHKLTFRVVNAVTYVSKNEYICSKA